MRALTEITESVRGMVTDQVYPFNIKPRMYVDRRDAVYLLGNQFDIG